MDTALCVGQFRINLDTTDSTNSVAAAHASDPANHGLVVTAGTQSAGRGQYQRVWQAPAGSSVLMSVLLFPPESLRRPSLLTAWAAVAVCGAVVRITGIRPSLKWPNDVLIDGRKVCGILCESGTHHVVAGIGFNVNQSIEDFARMQLPDATSLAICSNRRLDVGEVTAILIEQLDEEYCRLRDGQLFDVEQRWSDLFGLIGREVLIDRMDSSRMVGTLRSMSFQEIVIEQAEAIQQVPPEAIRHLRAI